ncbi:MAG: hypothetical protein ACOVME_08075, partial [Rhodobacter sp.]
MPGGRIKTFPDTGFIAIRITEDIRQPCGTALATAWVCADHPGNGFGALPRDPMAHTIPNWPVRATAPTFPCLLIRDILCANPFNDNGLGRIWLERVKGIEPSYSAWEA